MSRFREWLSQQDLRCVELFDADPNGVVATHLLGREEQRRTLRRSQAMESAMIEVVEAGLEQADWLGLLYVMGWGPPERFRPLYIGKAGKKGRKNPLSGNLVRIRRDKSKFARWGDGSAYHIGDLSQVLFDFEAYKGPEDKYRRWADMLFAERDPPRLRETTRLILVPWSAGGVGPAGEVVDLEALEAELIDVALAEFDDVVLNVKGETWWSSAASTVARPPDALRPRRPVRFVETEAQLTALLEELAGAPVLALGLDVETEFYKQALCLVQIACEKFTAVIDPLAIDPLRLRALLEDDKTVKVIHNASFERRVLGECGIEIRNVFDTLRASRQQGGKGHGLDAVCARELGLKMDKSVRRSDWRARPLSQAQLDYAALDAEVLLDLYAVFQRKSPDLPFGK